jgi:hypothetical protein
MSHWILDFKRRQYSGTVNQNFLWYGQNIYIMDNHRAALWCWLQHLNPDDRVHLLHIDQHYDTSSYTFSSPLQTPQQLASLSLPDYLNLDYESSVIEGYHIKSIQSGNYMTIFLDTFWPALETVQFVTQHQGDPPLHPVVENSLFEILHQLPEWFSQPGRWIVNIDLDMFFAPRSQRQVIRLVDNRFIEALARYCRQGLYQQKIIVLTIALSPEYCGSWLESEKALSPVLRGLDCPFRLIRKTSKIS